MEIKKKELEQHKGLEKMWQKQKPNERKNQVKTAGFRLPYQDQS